MIYSIVITNILYYTKQNKKESRKLYFLTGDASHFVCHTSVFQTTLFAIIQKMDEVTDLQV